MLTGTASHPKIVGILVSPLHMWEIKKILFPSNLKTFQRVPMLDPTSGDHCQLQDRVK